MEQVTTLLAAVERLVRLEEQMKAIVKNVEHIDVCVDDLKRTIWKATGAVTVVVLFSSWIVRHL